MPRLALASAVIAHMAGEDTKLSPANIHILVEGRVHEIRNAVESWHVVTPESKARKTEMESALERACQTVPRRGAVAAPMQRIALTTCPGGTCPDNALTRDLLGDFEGGSLVEQRIDIVQALRRHAVILMVHVDILAKVGLDAGNAHFE